MDVQSAALEQPLGNRGSFDRLISELDDFVFVLLDQDGNFTTWHPGVERCFGYPQEEFIGRNLETLYPLSDQLRGIPRLELDSALQTGRSSDSHWLVKRDGDRVYADGITLRLLDEEGKPTGFGKVVRDVTSRKNIEDNLVALTRALDQSIVVVRRWDGVISHWTEGCERQYGWSAREAIGQLTHVLLKTTFPEPLDRIQQQLMIAGSWKGELQHVRRDGTSLHISAQWILLNDSSANPISVIETLSDITDQVRAKGELEDANSRLKNLATELERSNRELEEFARIASHDLIAPITSTRWLVDLLSHRQGGKLDDTGRESLAQISDNLQRMSDLIAAVLTHAQVGRTPINSESVTSCDEALSIALNYLTQDVASSGAVITRDKLPDVNVDPQALNQLFQNLLSNAIKYRQQGRPLSVHVSASWKEECWLLSVQDNGIGISPEWHARIFQPLQRLHGREIPGSGIGLATCKKVVERAGGRIWVESAAGNGSTFFWTLPGPAQGQGNQT